MHLASFAMHRLLADADTRPVHDILLGFVEDVSLFKFILESSGKNRILITRELRALTSFINMVKDSSFSRPDLRLSEFLDELETMKAHNMPVVGRLVTESQDGVRIITAHASKGLEFHTCFIPFCLEDKNWPLKALPERIPLPPSIVKTKESVASKSDLRRLYLFDETRLFYVASSRAKSNLIFTSSPSEDNITSSFFNNLGITEKLCDTGELETLKQFFGKKPDDDPIKNAESALRILIKDLMLTPTKLNNFIKCKRKFLYDNLLLLPGRKRDPLVFGNSAHKALEDTYGRFKKEGNFPDFSFFSESFRRELRFQGAPKAMESACLAKLGTLEEWFKMAGKNPVVPIDLEKKKVITLKGGITFAGKFDKIEFENKKEGLVRIIDYKTGKPDKHIKNIEKNTSPASEDCDDYLRQLVAYKLLYENDTYEPAKYTVTHGELVFLEPVKESSRKYNLTKGSYANKKVQITDEMVSELENLILEKWKEINKLEFDKLPERDQKKCGFCVFNSICWE